MLASLCSGCATGTPRSMAMNNVDLNYFQPDCRIAPQQMQMLLRMRRSADDQLFSMSGWLGQDRHTNWLIDNHIRYLRDYC